MGESSEVERGRTEASGRSKERGAGAGGRRRAVVWAVWGTQCWTEPLERW